MSSLWSGEKPRLGRPTARVPRTIHAGSSPTGGQRGSRSRKAARAAKAATVSASSTRSEPEEGAGRAEGGGGVTAPRF